MMSRFTKLLLIIVILITTPVAQALPENKNGETDLKVTILVFSGYTNPSYFFPSDSITQLADLLKATQVDNAIQETLGVPTTLDYHGIIVDNPSLLGNLPRRFLVNKEKIELEKQDVKEILIDQDKAVEELLLKKARELEVIDNKILHFIETGEL